MTKQRSSGSKDFPGGRVVAIEEGREVYYAADEQGTFTRLSHEDYKKLPSDTKQKAQRRAAIAARNAAQRESRAIAAGQQPAGAGREARTYRRHDATLGARRILRELLGRPDSGSSNEKQPGPYRGNNGKVSSRKLGGLTLQATLLSPIKGVSDALSLGGVSQPKIFELSTSEQDKVESAAAFRESIVASKANNEFGAAVYVYDQAEYEGMRLFLTEDRLAGFSLKGNVHLAYLSLVTADRRIVIFGMNFLQE